MATLFAGLSQMMFTFSDKSYLCFCDTLVPVDLIVSVFAECMVDVKENIDDNLLDSFRSGNRVINHFNDIYKVHFDSKYKC